MSLRTAILFTTKTTASEQTNKPGFIRLLRSVLAAAIGVQREKNRQSDFSQKSALPYIVAGIVFTFALIGILIAVVSMII